MSSDQSVTIRPATADEDFDAIAQLYLTVWRSAYAGMIPAATLADLSSADVVNLLVLAKNQAARRFYDCIGFHDTGQHLVDTMPDGTKLINQIYRL